MLTFFRRIRKSLTHSLPTGQAGRYILYAIGEIALVVIGILIALAINNQNQLNKNEEKVQLLLEEIQEELLTDIERIDEVIAFWQKKDSLLDIVLNEELTARDYAVGRGLLSLIIQYETIELSDNGYNNLVKDMDIIPKKYAGILLNLNQLYLNDKNDLETFNEQLKRFVTGILDKWSREKEWFSTFYNYSKVDDAVEYFLSDPFYKNDCARLKITVYDNYIPFAERSRFNATKLYLEIESILESDNELPKIISDYAITIPASTLNIYRAI